MATCRPTLFLLTMKEILLVHFIITNFRVAHKMLCTPWLRKRNPLTISRLSCLGKRPWRQFFSRFVKVRFRILDIQITILLICLFFITSVSKIYYINSENTVTCLEVIFDYKFFLINYITGIVAKLLKCMVSFIETVVPRIGHLCLSLIG
jgi:hypothetical protein